MSSTSPSRRHILRGTLPAAGAALIGSSALAGRAEPRTTRVLGPALAPTEIADTAVFLGVDAARGLSGSVLDFAYGFDAGYTA